MKLRPRFLTFCHSMHTNNAPALCRLYRSKVSHNCYFINFWLIILLVEILSFRLSFSVLFYLLLLSTGQACY